MCVTTRTVLHPLAKKLQHQYKNTEPASRGDPGMKIRNAWNQRTCLFICVFACLFGRTSCCKRRAPSGFGASFKFHPGKTPVTWFVTKSSGWCGLSSVIRKNSRIVRAHRVSMVVPSSSKGSLCNTMPHKWMPYLGWKAGRYACIIPDHCVPSQRLKYGLFLNNWSSQTAKPSSQMLTNPYLPVD